MKKIESLKEIQLIELDILDFIDQVCGQYGLRYFLAGGTLLGAVRHKGFIPWDNDMDISMPRKDYDIFTEKFNEYAYQNGMPYEVLKITNSGHYCCPFIKVVDKRTILQDGEHQKFKGRDMGVFVDIFPIDGLASNSEKEVERMLSARNKCINLSLSFAEFTNLNFKETIKLSLYKMRYSLKNREALLNKFQNEMRQNDFDRSPYIMSTFGLRGKKEVMEQSLFSKSITLEFENKSYPAPIGYREYLTQMYGDYMMLPPVEKRVVPHDFEGYWLEEK